MNTGNSPYETKPNDKSIRHTLDPHRQIDKYKEDEASQKAPKVLPHEMENINKFLGDTFVSLIEIRNILVAAGKNKEISVHAVDNIKEKIDEINKIVLEIPEELDKIGI
jgi:hypothetical protein